MLQAKEDKNRNVNISTETATTNFQDKAKETTFAPTQINSVSEKRRKSSFMLGACDHQLFL